MYTAMDFTLSLPSSSQALSLSLLSTFCFVFLLLFCLVRSSIYSQRLYESHKILIS